MEKLFIRSNYEPEYDETVEHDIVMIMIDGKLTEVDADDSKVRE